MLTRVLATMLLATVPLHAQTPATPDDQSIARWEISVTVAGMAAALAASSLFNPASCHWCESTSSGADAVNGLDRSTRDALRWADANVRNADAISFLTVYAPFGVALVRRDLDERGTLTVLESLTAASLVTQVAKIAVARERPAFHYRPPGTSVLPEDRNTSFFSGHSAQAFAVLVSAAREISASGRSTKWLWIYGAPLAAATAYFRIAGDRHYLTDVLAGAGVGTVIGYGVPALHAPRSTTRPDITASVHPHGGEVTAVWRW